MKIRQSIILLALLILAFDATAMTLNQAVKKVQRETGGQVLSAKTIQTNNKRSHKIKVLLPNGRVKTLLLPADDRQFKHLTLR